MKYIALCLLVCSISICLTGQSSDKPRIGLTLSGGGAKGLAHIGILQAIDSAGLEISAITGTSMGAVVGSLYSIGYSGKELEKLARELDWTGLFLSIPKLNEVGMLQKEDYGRYPIQLPLERGKIKPYNGVLEAQGIWEEFGKLYLPVYNIDSFADFNIPFECMATNLGTGEAVVLKSGDIVTAVRASMAIPSIFTTVEYNGAQLIDGGVVRNFPVENLKDYDIDYAIGVNLSQGLLSAEKLRSPIDVLLQIAFYKDADNFYQQKELCDLLIEPGVSEFSSGSFGSSDSLIDIGIREGRKYYPYFKALADSLNDSGEQLQTIGSRLPVFAKVIIDAIEVNGLGETEIENFKGQLGLFAGKAYDAQDFSDAVDNAYSTLSYRKIRYQMVSQKDGHAIMKFDVEENPKAFFNIGLHYTPYSGAALVLGSVSQNQFTRFSRTSLKLNVSENFRVRLKHQQFFTDKQRWGIEFSGYYENFQFPVYIDFIERYRYRSSYGNLDLNVFEVLGRSNKTGIGIRKEWLSLKPEVAPAQFYTGSNTFWRGYFFFERNTQDEPAFPHRGAKVHLDAGLIFEQNPDAAFTDISDEIQLGDSVKTQVGNYLQLNVKMAKYFPIKKKVTIITQLNSGINTKPKSSFVNYYSVGGLQDFLRNQIVFAGLKENEVNTNSIVSTQLGVQVEPIDKFFVTLRANTALYDFVGTEAAEWTESNFLSGYSLSVGNSSILGPIEVSLLYCDQSKTFNGYIVVGFAF